MIYFNNIPLSEYEKYMQYVTMELSRDEFPSEINIPNYSWCDYFDIIYKAFGKERPSYNLLEKDLPVIDIPENKNSCAIAFSGGKDCTASLCYLTDRGIDCSLYFALDANKAYPDEKNTARDVAEYFGKTVNYFKLYYKGRSAQKEFVCKNHLIMSYIITYMIKSGQTNLCTGSYIEDTLDKTSQIFGLSDAYELFLAFEKAIKKTFKNFKHVVIFPDEFEALKYIVNHHRDVISLYRSCITSDRFRKYNIELASKEMDCAIPNNRCGHCWKCCQEMFILNKLGVLDLTERDFSHIYNRFIYNLDHVVSEQQAKLLRERIKNNDLTTEELVSYYVTLPKPF